ncbi:unnamed protein product [Cuscuta campestris]|uniref:Uncharacterized protein n=1 Tax=Cuscuta campestris TaxID=132261 RepID=A0A484LNQ4_9ASTE|nr:unnamed protein product [Cuscuta campestris]
MVMEQGLEAKQENTVEPFILNQGEQLIIDGLLKQAPFQVQEDGPIQVELNLQLIDDKEDKLARGDHHKEFEILLLLFEKHISDDFEQSIWVIKEALRSPFIKEKIQKGLVRTLEGKAIKATREAMKSAQCIRAIKLKGTRHQVLLSCANIDEPILTAMCGQLIDYD